MNKILVTFFILSLEEEYDLFIPIGVKLKDVLDMVQNTIKELSNDNYEINPSPTLYSDLDGSVININNIVKFSGLKNGSRVLLK